jgi:hypothetical protein
MPYLFIQEFEVSATLIPTIDLVFCLGLFRPGSIIASPGIVFIVLIIVISRAVQRIVILQSFFTV